MVFTRDKTLDQHELEIYKQEARPTLVGRPVKALAFYGAHQDLEGPPTEGTVIIEFPTIQDAKAWYDSPAYRQARDHRMKGANYRVLLIEGVPQS
jgi:uncharacterized protein (DUF1330 family)